MRRWPEKTSVDAISMGMSEARSSIWPLANETFAGVDRQRVAALVFRVFAVAANPVEGKAVRLAKFVEFAPEVFVLDWFFGSGLPPTRDPLVEPFVEAIEDVLAVRMDFDITRFLDGAKAFDDRGELHAVVGGVALGACLLFFPAAVGMFEDERPASRPGIARAGAVGEEQQMMRNSHGQQCTVTLRPIRSGRAG